MPTCSIPSVADSYYATTLTALDVDLDILAGLQASAESTRELNSHIGDIKEILDAAKHDSDEGAKITALSNVLSIALHVESDSSKAIWVMFPDPSDPSYTIATGITGAPGANQRAAIKSINVIRKSDMRVATKAVVKFGGDTFTDLKQCSTNELCAVYASALDLTLVQVLESRNKFYGQSGFYPLGLAICKDDCATVKKATQQMIAYETLFGILSHTRKPNSKDPLYVATSYPPFPLAYKSKVINDRFLTYGSTKGDLDALVTDEPDSFRKVCSKIIEVQVDLTDQKVLDSKPLSAPGSSMVAAVEKPKQQGLVPAHAGDDCNSCGKRGHHTGHPACAKYDAHWKPKQRASGGGAHRPSGRERHDSRDHRDRDRDRRGDRDRRDRDRDGSRGRYTETRKRGRDHDESREPRPHVAKKCRHGTGCDNLFSGCSFKHGTPEEVFQALQKKFGAKQSQ
jgi:hypothetical protein